MELKKKRPADARFLFPYIERKFERLSKNLIGFAANLARNQNSQGLYRSVLSE